MPRETRATIAVLRVRRASFAIALSASRLKVTVPAGASAGPITVTNSTAPAGTVRAVGGYTP